MVLSPSCWPSPGRRFGDPGKQGWYVASFELEGCGKKINVGDIPLGQQITVDLSDFGCFNDPVALRVFYYYWGWQTFTGHQPTTFTRFIGNWWKLDWGSSYSNRDSPLRLIMRGVGWAPEMFVIDD